jgi:hypothetical protein
MTSLEEVIDRLSECLEPLSDINVNDDIALMQWYERCSAAADDTGLDIDSKYADTWRELCEATLINEQTRRNH